MTSTALTRTVLWVVALAAGCVGGIILIRVSRRLRLAYRAPATARARALLLSIVAGGNETAARDGLCGLDRWVWQAVQPNAVALLGKVRGDARASLVSVFEQRGIARRAAADLRCRGAARRGRAAEILGVLGAKDTVGPLCALLGDTDRQVRIAAARALGAIGDPDTIAPLLASLHGPQPVAAQLVADAVLRIGAAAQPALMVAIADDDPLVRLCAIEVLGLVGAVPAVEPMSRALRADPSVEVRTRAATALGRVGTRSALPALLHALTCDPSAPVRAASATALGEVTDPAAVPALVASLSDPHHWVASGAAAALARLGGPGERELRRVAAVVDPVGPADGSARGSGDGPGSDPVPPGQVGNRAAAHAREALATAQRDTSRRSVRGERAAAVRSGTEPAPAPSDDGRRSPPVAADAGR